MPIETASVGVRPVGPAQQSNSDNNIRRTPGTSDASGFAPETKVSIRSAIKDMAGVLAQINNVSADFEEQMPQKMKDVVDNIMRQAFSLDETLAQSLGSTLESQRFSVEQLRTFSRMLAQMGNLLEKGGEAGTNDTLTALLKNFKTLLSDEGNGTEPVLLTKAAFMLVDDLPMEQLPPRMQRLFAALQQPYQGELVPNREGMGFLRQLLQYFMPQTKGGNAVTPMPGQPQMTQNGQAQQPGQAQMAQTGQAQQPGQAQMTQNGQAQQPGQAQMIQNGQAQQPGQAQMQQNGQAQQPGQAQMTQNGQAQQPGQPQMIQNGQAQQPGQAQMAQNGQAQQPGQPQMTQNGQAQQPGQAQMTQNGQAQQPGQAQMAQIGQAQQPGQSQTQRNGQYSMAGQPQQNDGSLSGQSYPASQTGSQMDAGRYAQQARQTILQGQQTVGQGQQMAAQGQRVMQQGMQMIQQGMQLAQQGQTLAAQGQEMATDGQQMMEQGRQILQQEGQASRQGQQLVQQGQQTIEQGKQMQTQGEQMQAQGKQMQTQGQQNLQQGLRLQDKGQQTIGQGQSMLQEARQALPGQDALRGAMQQAKAEMMGQPIQNTPQTMATLRGMARLLLRDAQLTPQETHLLQNFVSEKMQQLPEKDARQLQTLLRICQRNIPAAVQQAAIQRHMPELPRLWAFMQLADMTAASDLPPHQLHRISHDLQTFANAINQSLDSAPTPSNQQVPGQRSLDFMMPLYMGQPAQNYPAYIHVYDEEKPDKRTGIMKKESWFRVCVLTENIGAVDATFRVYEGARLDMRIFFSQPEQAEAFTSYVPALRRAILTTRLQLRDVKISAV